MKLIPHFITNYQIITGNSWILFDSEDLQDLVLSGEVDYRKFVEKKSINICV